MSSENKAFTVVGIGEILWDVFADCKQLGGAPANLCYHANNLGANAFIVSSVGDDDFGREILSVLERKNLSAEYIAIDKEHPTGRVDVTLNDDGVPEYIIRENVAWDFIDFNDKIKTLAENSDAVAFGTLASRNDTSKHSILEFLTQLNQNTLKLFDINLRQKYYNSECIEQFLELSTILKINDEEIEIVAELLNIPGDETALLSKLQKSYSLDMIALTKGHNGSRLFTPHFDSYLPSSENLTIADTVGAGDAFAAALITGILKHRRILSPQNITTIHKQAKDIAEKVCGEKGGMPDIYGS